MLVAIMEGTEGTATRVGLHGSGDIMNGDFHDRPFLGSSTSDAKEKEKEKKKKTLNGMAS